MNVFNLNESILNGTESLLNLSNTKELDFELNQIISSENFSVNDTLSNLTSSLIPESNSQELNKTAILEKLARSLLPTGIPDYGIKENLSFDNPNYALDWFASYDSQIDHWKFADLNHERYVGSAGSISCEFCCGATATINPDGTILCYCNHTAALRGASKYLVLNTNMTEGEILRELTLWKTAWFPEPMIQKALDITLRNETVNISSLNIPAYIGGC